MSKKKEIIIKIPVDGKRAAPSDGVLIIPTDAQKKKIKKHNIANAANVKVISTLDMRATKQAILNDWRRYTPEHVVGIFRKNYTNKKSLSTMLSRFKTQLSSIRDPPPIEYLEKIKLKKEEYNDIRKAANEVRTKGSLNVLVLSNADSIVMQALQYIVSNDPNLLFAAVCVLTGLRPIEIVKQARFSMKLNNDQGQFSPWFACQTRFAKRGNMKTKYNQCRDRPFLCPYWLIERALNVIRKRWPVKHMTNVQVNSKFGSNFCKILVRAYPQWLGVNARLCRRFFAVYSYRYFGSNFGNGNTIHSSLIGYCSWVLGHSTLGDEAIPYQSLVLKPEPKLKLFEITRDLKTH